jgi:hypothetical protein
MDKFDELFMMNKEDEKPPQMTINDFVNKTRDILSKIDREMTAAYKWRMLTDDEYEIQEQFCNNCNGDGSILKDGVNLRCVCDKKLGGCFVLELQYEAFFNEIESIMYMGDNYSFYELLFCEIIDPKNETKN